MSKAERAEAGFEVIEAYIWIIQNTVAQDIATQSVMDIFEATERKQVAQVGLQ